MKSFIITGSGKAINEYIENYIKQNSVRSYNVIRFENKIKISDTREIKKILSIRLPQDEKRLILLSVDMTIEAQNALLKILEELPLNTDIILCGSAKDSLLPTIISRSFLINLKNNSTDLILDEEYKKIIIEYISKSVIVRKNDNNMNNIKTALIFSDKILPLDLNLFIKSLRSLLISVMLGKEKMEDKQIAVLYKIIFKLNELYPLLSSNNLNKKLTIDNILLECLIKS